MVASFQGKTAAFYKNNIYKERGLPGKSAPLVEIKGPKRDLLIHTHRASSR
jgi:hypothetical protein